MSTKIAPLLSVLLATGLVGCGGDDSPAGGDLAQSVTDPCAAMDRSSPPTVAVSERDAYHRVLRERCTSLRCEAYEDAVQAGDGDAVGHVIGPLVGMVTAGRSEPDPAPLPESCRSAVLLQQARLAYARARGAADSRPPNWDEALAALDAVPELPGELVPLAGDTSVADRIHLGCYRDGTEHVRRSVAAAEWGSVASLATITRTCGESLPTEQRPPSEELTALTSLARRARGCTLVVEARDAEVAEDVADRIRDALEEFESLPAGTERLTGSERSALATARAAALREAGRCDRQVALNDRCQERCLVVGEYRSGDWMDRCAEYCDGRAPLCADQRERWESAGRPRSGVTVALPRFCSAAAHPTSRSAPPGRSHATSGRTRGGVSLGDFE